MANQFEYSRQERKKRPRRGFSRFTLKVIAGIFMALNVCSLTVFQVIFGAPSAENVVSLNVCAISNIVSWIAVPIYAWLLYTGYQHTRNAWLYGLRIFLLAVICEIPYNYIASDGNPFWFASQNPVWGLLIALIVMSMLDWLRLFSRSIQIPISILIVMFGGLWEFFLRVGVMSEELNLNLGILTLIFVLIFYYLDGRENTMMLSAGLIGATFFVTPAIGVALLHYRNGKEGMKHKWTKWVFYLLYPALLGIGCLASGTSM
ncbi:ABC transporter permease [Bifidobacterium dolichotidis]|uniref:ABC transporter permease n=1 Tax=Bifidobacterium dolichotidis TaxID=2306976 RepID=A0A430FKH1_9BIFI|nr:TraX family protein [Bifidobacterium dolichotidis]RSX53389.1 ABC transporter permease [Bifidobacterium dolichotidis]